LDHGRRAEQRQEHQQDQQAHAAKLLVHASPPEAATAIGAVSMTHWGWLRTASERRSSSATMIQFAISEEPPAARKGVVRPVSGMTRVTPPTTMNTCSAT